MTTDYKSFSREKLIEMIDMLDIELNKLKNDCDSLVSQNKVLEINLVENLNERDIKDHKQIELALLESENRYSKVFHASPYAVLISRAEDGIIIDANKAFTRISGLERDEAIANSTLVLQLWNNIEDRNQVVADLGSGKEVSEREFRFSHKQGNILTCLFSAELIKFNNDTYILSIINDITERKQVEEKLIESEERFRQIVEQSRGVVWEVDANGLYTYASPLSTSVYGFTPGQIVGKLHFYDLHPEEDREKFKEAAFGIFHRKESFKNLVSYGLNANGEGRYVSTNGIPLLNAEGDLIGYRGIDTDVTDQVNAENELRKFRTISEQANFGSAITDLDGILIYANKAFAELHGYEIDELIGKPLTMFHTPDRLPRVNELVKEIYKKGGFSSEEVIHVKKDGTEFPTIMSASLIYDSNNMPQFYSATIMDITELKESEKALKKSEENMKFAQEIAKMGSWEFNLVTREIECSENFYRIVGFKPDEIDFTYDFLLKTVHQDDLHIIIESTERLVTTRQPVNVDLRFVMKDASEKWLKTYIVPEVVNNQVTAFRGVSVDITEQKYNEDQIREMNVNLEEKINQRTKQLADINSELLQRTGELENFFNLSLDLLCIGDKTGNLLKVSKSWEIMLGYPLEEIEHSNFLKFVYSKDIDSTLEALKQLNENPDSPHFFINKHLKKDGSLIYLEWQTFPAGDFVYAAGRDVTEQKRTSEFENELLDITPKLTGIPFSEINNAIDMSLKRIGSFLGADRSYVFELDKSTKTWSNTFEWCNEGIEPQKEYLQDYAFNEAPEIANKLFDLEDVIIPSVKDLPLSWQAEREILEPQGIKSLIIVPLINENNLIGFIGLDSVIKQRIFTRSEVNILRVLGNMLASLINHRHQEEIIEQTHKNYETFFNTVDDFLLVFDEEGKIIYMNEAVVKRLGYSHEESIGQAIFKVYPKDRRDEVRRASYDAINGITEGFSIPIVAKNGTIIPVETRLKRGFWNGKPAIFGVTKDISAITLSEEKFSKAFQSNAALMSISNLKTGKFIDVNDAFLKNLDITFEEVIGKTTDELNLLNDKNLLDRILENLKHNIPVRDFEVEVNSKSGKQIIGLFSADLIYIGKDLCFLSVLIDITERKRAEEEVKRQTGLITSLLDSIPDIIFFKDFHGVYLGCNPPFAELVSKTKNEVTGKTDYDLFDKETADSFRFNDNLMLEDKKPRHNEEWVTYPDTRKILVDTLKTTYTTSDGKLIGVLGISRDITERKLAEEEIIRAKNEAEKANHAKSEFLSRMSHELRTPMNSILGFAQLLEMGELTSGQKKGVNHIIKSGKHLLDLINEVLDISRIEAGRLSLSIEPVNVPRIINEIIDIVNPFAYEKDLNITFTNNSDKLLYVNADSQRLKQVLLNLLNNAIKYNVDSGLVSIMASSSKNTTDDGYSCRISISDTGVGISGHDIHKLFTPFERIGLESSNVEGTGLGLAVVKKLMDAMKGKLGVESEKGKGSTFWIELPLNNSQIEGAGISPVPISDEKHKGHKGTILYIEDNISNVELIEQILLNQRPEIRLIANPNGKLAVKLAAEYLPDLILLDLNLPDIHGIDVINTILRDELTKSIPVVIVSADAMPLQIQRLKNAGAKDYIAKPLNIIDFLKTIDKYVI
jgi:PAS domain S-box-containing protein